MINIILNDCADVHLLRYSISKIQVIAKSSRLECRVLRVHWLCWALMPCHLSC